MKLISGGGSSSSVAPLTIVDNNTVAQSNTTNGQTFLLYNTVDSVASPTNYERLSIAWNAGQTNFRLATQAGGTGTVRSMDFQTGGTFGILSTAGSRVFIVNNTGNISQYANAATAGLGVVVIRASGRSLAQAAAVASVATFTPVADASFEVSANILVTTATTHAFTATCAYTDEGNTARTVTLNFSLVAGGAFTTSIANANGAVPYLGMPIHIRAKAATAITIATTGTFTTVAYNVEATIRQIA